MTTFAKMRYVVKSQGVTTMAADVQIQCINITTRTNPHERISHVGGVNPNGTRWKLTLDEAIKGIENGTWTFYTLVNGRRANVIIATHNGHKYLKTVNDGLHPDNLLALPDCP